MIGPILFLDQYGDIGGGQTVLLSLLRTAAKISSEVSVLAPGGGALEVAIKENFGTSVSFIPCEEPRLTHGRKDIGDILTLLSYGWRFRKYLPLLRRQDVIYVNGLRHLPHMLVFSRALRGRLIYHVHIDLSALEKSLLRLAVLSRRAFRLVVNSRFVAAGLGIASNHVSLIENALDPMFASRPFVDRFQKSGPWVSAVIGTLRPEKGQDIAVQAVRAHGDMVLHMIGRDGDGAKDWIISLKHNAGPQIRFEGIASDVPEKLDAFQVQFNLVPSRWQEPFGLVAIEGMACSCLTIVSGSGGLAEIAEKTGAIVAHDEAELEAALRRLCAMQPQDLTDIARQQYEQAQQHYAPERFDSGVLLLLEAAGASMAEFEEKRSFP